MRIGSEPLIPAYPLRPDRQAVYPRALGKAFVGTPFMTLPEVKAVVPKAETAPKAAVQPLPGKEATERARLNEPPPAEWRAEGLDLKEPGLPAPGSLVDLRA